MIALTLILLVALFYLILIEWAAYKAKRSSNEQYAVSICFWPRMYFVTTCYKNKDNGKQMIRVEVIETYADED